MDRILKKNRSASQTDWSTNGSFMNKPMRGWLHPDEQLAADAGVCYGVRYIGSMEVKHSMKSLDFQSRTSVAKASISRVCDAAGLKTASKKCKWPSKITKMLGDQPNLLYAGSNVNLTINIECMNVIVMETGDMITYHDMPGISFASGGDTDTVDFVAYVAKDLGGRACHVLECGGGLAQDVITTMGQAFELRFKQYLSSKPTTFNLPDRLEETCLADVHGDAWGSEHEYYNDRPGAIPPDKDEKKIDLSKIGDEPDALPVQVKTGNLIDFGPPDAYDNTKGAVGGTSMAYDNLENGNKSAQVFDNLYDNKENKPANGVVATDDNTPPTELDPFDMTPFCLTLPSNATPPKELRGSPYNEKWFHGKISRQQCARLLKKDGDYLVRESAMSGGQFVLSSRRDNQIKHLLLVDPNGVVRTKDRSFNSVSHLIEYHCDNHCPITSNDSEIFLKTAVNQPYS